MSIHDQPTQPNAGAICQQISHLCTQALNSPPTDPDVTRGFFEKIRECAEYGTKDKMSARAGELQQAIEAAFSVLYRCVPFVDPNTRTAYRILGQTLGIDHDLANSQ